MAWAPSCVGARCSTPWFVSIVSGSSCTKTRERNIASRDVLADYWKLAHKTLLKNSLLYRAIKGKIAIDFNKPLIQNNSERNLTILYIYSSPQSYLSLLVTRGFLSHWHLELSRNVYWVVVKKLSLTTYTRHYFHPCSKRHTCYCTNHVHNDYLSKGNLTEW